MKLASLQRLAYLCSTGAMRTTPSGALTILGTAEPPDIEKKESYGILKQNGKPVKMKMTTNCEIIDAGSPGCKDGMVQ